MELSEKLYELRKNNSWSQEEFAEKLEVSRQTVSKWESGKAVPELNKLVKISEIYNITLDELVKDVSEEKNNNVEKTKNKKRLKIVLCIILVIILIICVLFCLNILRRVNIIHEISENYSRDFIEIGNTRSGRVLESITKRDLNNIEETHREYIYYVGEDGKKLLKMRTFENSEFWQFRPIEEYYIDLSNVNEKSGIMDEENPKISDSSDLYKTSYYNVTKINLNDRSREIINDFSFESPVKRATRAMNNHYSIISAWNNEFPDKKLVFDFNNKFNKYENGFYMWNNEKIHGTSNNIYVSFDYQNFNLYFDNYQDDIKEKREIVEITIQNIHKPIEEDMLVPEI